MTIRCRCAVFCSAALTMFSAATITGNGKMKPPPNPATDDQHVSVNIRKFSHLVKADDWSPAIQAAIDYVSKDNGFDAGGTVLFPAGAYRIDRPIVVGERPAHWGLRLLGYGATLVGTPKLDKRPLPDPEPERDVVIARFEVEGPDRSRAQVGAAAQLPEGERLKRQPVRVLPLAVSRVRSLP